MCTENREPTENRRVAMRYSNRYSYSLLIVPARMNKEIVYTAENAPLMKSDRDNPRVGAFAVYRAKIRSTCSGTRAEAAYAFDKTKKKKERESRER